MLGIPESYPSPVITELRKYSLNYVIWVIKICSCKLISNYVCYSIIRVHSFELKCTTFYVILHCLSHARAVCIPACKAIFVM